MTAQLLQQMKLVINPDQVMNGFCYNYAKALLEKLKELNQSGEIKETEYELSGIGMSVSQSLSQQISYSIPIDVPKHCDKLIETAEEFLAIFEKT